MLNKKGQGNIVPTVILTSVIVTLTIIVAGYSLIILESIAQEAEFNRVKVTMVNLAWETVNSIISGYESEISFTSRTIKLNFLTVDSELKLEISGLPKTPLTYIIDNEILTIKCLAGNLVTTGTEILTGSKDEIVFTQDIYSLPFTIVAWDKNFGRASISLNFTRLLIQEYNYPDELIIDLTYIDISWTSSTTVSLNKIEINYLNTRYITLYSKHIAKQSTVTFKLYLDDNLLGQTSVTIPGDLNLTIRLVVHRIRYFLR